MDHAISHGVNSFHFDFNKNLQCPKLACQDSYYASKLTTYAFGVHSAETRKGTVYIWPESIAPKNPDTLLSCLNYHLSVTEEENRSWNIFWADNARSQNKNFTVALYFEHLVASGARQRVDFKFLISGHSYADVDRDGGRAESVIKRHETLETPADYVNLINGSSLSPNITWIEMAQPQFKCYSTWLRTKYNDSRKDINGRPFRFSDMAHLNYGIGERVDPRDMRVKTFSHPGIVWMRKSLDPREDPIEVCFTKDPLETTRSSNLRQLNNRLIKIHEKKRHDLKNLSKFLSPQGRRYYLNVINN